MLYIALDLCLTHLHALTAAPFAKHVPAHHHKVLRTQNYEHVALTPAQKIGHITVQAKCSGGGICPFHSGLVSGKTNLNITLGIKTLLMVMTGYKTVLKTMEYKEK